MADFVIRRWDLAPRPFPQAPLHVHDHGDEAFAVLDGLLDVTVGEEVRRLEPGEFVVVPAGTPHTFATVGDASASVLATMTPQIDQLVQALHACSDDERDAVWARHDSRPV